MARWWGRLQVHDADCPMTNPWPEDRTSCDCWDDRGDEGDRAWRHPVQAARTFVGLLRNDYGLRDAWNLTVHPGYRSIYRRAQVVDPWPPMPPYTYTTWATPAEFLEERRLSVGCCNAVWQPHVHRVHVHDIRTGGGLAIAVAAVPPTCECGRPWPCERLENPDA